MKLYHASDIVIENPDVYHSREHLDFGRGFYLTSMRSQAEKYAQRFLLRGKRAFVNEYLLDEDLSDYVVKVFKVMMKNGWIMWVNAERDSTK